MGAYIGSYVVPLPDEYAPRLVVSCEDERSYPGLGEWLYDCPDEVTTNFGVALLRAHIRRTGKPITEDHADALEGRYLTEEEARQE